MSNIERLLNHILSAVYGKDVRQSIHDSIKECYTDVTRAKTLADDSVATANEKIAQCTSATTAANTAASAANSAAANANKLGLIVVDGKLCVEVVRE